MILYEYPLFKMSRKLLLLVGQWPYDVGNKKYLIRAVICLVPILACITEIYELISAKSKFEQIMNVLPLFTFMMVVSLKYMTYWTKNGGIRDVLEFISLDCDALRSESEVEIIKSSVAEGWILGKSYIMITYGALGGFILMLFIPSILDIIKPLDESRTEKLLNESGYLTNIHGYSVYVILNIQCVIVEGVMIIVAADLLFMAVVTYFCGMFSIAGYRLEHMFDEVQLISNSEKKAVIHQRILNAVTQQLNIVKFVLPKARLGTNLAMSCYTISFAVQFFVIVLAIATTLVNIRNGLASRNHILVFALIFAMLAYYFGVFVNITPGQNLVDRSSELLNKLYSSNWYQAPLKSQKLLPFMMQKAEKPLIPSAAGTIDMTYETCSMIVQTSFSYFMMLSSIEK